MLTRCYEDFGQGLGDRGGRGGAPIWRATMVVDRQYPAGDDFGTRLMRLRLGQGRSLTQVARQVHVSKSYLGNLETGRKRPSPLVAAVCDEAFGAGGALVKLAAARVPAVDGRAPIPSPGGELAHHTSEEVADPRLLLSDGDEYLCALRGTAQRRPPRLLAVELAARSLAVARAADTVRGPTGHALWLLAARCAEFTGWLAQESGQDALAWQWTETAARWAVAGGDRDMAAYRWERHALTTLYSGDAQRTIALARRGAIEPRASARVIGLARRREAQGHALAGDRAACERALDEATALLARGPAPYPGGTSWGPNSIGDASGFVRASCLVDLGAYRAAADLIGPDPGAGVFAGAARTRVRFAARGALAFACGGELDHACALVENLLPEAAWVDSATVRADLRRLIGVFHRRRLHPRAQALLPDLYNSVRVR